MGFIDSLVGSGLDPETDRLVTGVLKRYEQAQFAQSVSGGLMDRLTGKHAYDEENRNLDLALKRRALGLQDSDDFDESRNSDDTLLAAGFNGILQKIPEPGFLSPKMASRGKTLLSNTIASGEKYVLPGFIGRLARAIR